MNMPRFLLDTNILIYLVAGENDALRDRVEEHEPGVIVTSTLCVAEALYGVTEDKQKVALGRLLTAIEPLPFGLPEARRFPDVPFRRGKLDRFIASHALATGLTIVTNNESDFVDVPGLVVENWTLPA
ncbi:type II toxin-antitoxin system VapC family toxin [Sphingomonas sp. CLY1604]|uniref:type II toxin-antitoxin system VapC family toxin n=1 Tax=Sphingomonas sp. CLY1604 TaxID=3457786 RepID=UPI003FD7AE66